MNTQAKNTIFFTIHGEAEIFWQTVNCDHILETYREDFKKPNVKERVHDLKFRDIAKALQDSVMVLENAKSNKYRAISFYNNRYYRIFFHLEERTDSRKLFAVIVSCYATSDAKDIKIYKDSKGI
jgi:hypothetical protein